MAGGGAATRAAGDGARVTLRARLAAVLAVVVLLPAVAVAIVAGYVVPHRLDDQARARGHLLAVGAAAGVTQVCSRANAVAEVLARRALMSAPQAAAASVLADRLAGGAALLDRWGGVVAAAGPGFVADARACGTEPASGGLVLAKAAVRGATVRSAVVAIPAATVALELPHERGAQLELIAGGRVVATGGASVSGHQVGDLVEAAPGRPFAVRVAEPTASYVGLRAGVLLVLLVLLVVAVLLARRFARLATRPLAMVADAAQRVAAGDLDTAVPVVRDDDLGRMAGAFNAMTTSLRAHIGELERSRDELRRSVERLGDTLTGTLDVERILAVVLDTAMATTGATGGAVLLDESGPLCRRVVRGERPEVERRTVAVPLPARDRAAGSIELYDKGDGTPFGADDVRAVRALALQAAVAIENVLLHEEAQRLSVTDGLTGLWNRRYLMSALRGEIERSSRYQRSLAVLVLDVDRFKHVNDEHGHGRGDVVLTEVADRLRAELRDTDVAARYGGEEFVLVLPETDASGAISTCQRICAAIREQPFARGGVPLHITVSVGAAIYPTNAVTCEDLVSAADTALYAAKRTGRDGWWLAEAVARAQIHLDQPASAAPPT